VRHQNSVFHQLLKQVPWTQLEELVRTHNAEPDPRGIRSKTQLIAMIYAQLSGARGLREITEGLQSHAGRLYHLGSTTVSRSALATANATRPPAVFMGVLQALMARLQRRFRRKVEDCVRLIDSTSLPLNAHSAWAGFSAGVYGAKAHIVYDPNADQPLYLMVTEAKVNDITAAHQMPIEPGATYVFDLGYYDFAWWARLDADGCRIVTRLKKNTPFTVVEQRPITAGSPVLSDALGHLPQRLAASRRNPIGGLVREIRVRNQTGVLLRIFTNDRDASADEIAALYQRRWDIELFFRWIKQTLKIAHFFGTSHNAVRIQVIVALMTFLLLRLAHETNRIVSSPLAFARLIRANLMHRRPLQHLLRLTLPHTDPRQHQLGLPPPQTSSPMRRSPRREAAA
jgi:IS4 transposase